MVQGVTNACEDTELVVKVRAKARVLFVQTVGHQVQYQKYQALRITHYY